VGPIEPRFLTALLLVAHYCNQQLSEGSMLEHDCIQVPCACLKEDLAPAAAFVEPLVKQHSARKDTMQQPRKSHSYLGACLGWCA
jgi:hypothetical protein